MRKEKKAEHNAVVAEGGKKRDRDDDSKGDTWQNGYSLNSTNSVPSWPRSRSQPQSPPPTKRARTTLIHPTTSIRGAIPPDHRTVTSKSSCSSSKASPDPQIDRLTPLSTELIIRILHLLPLPDLLTIQCLSRRFEILARDSQIWKGLYYERFVKPRARRLPRTSGGNGMEDLGNGEGHEYHGKIKPKKTDGILKRTMVKEKTALPPFSSRRSKWLDEEVLLSGEEWKSAARPVAFQTHNEPVDDKEDGRKSTDIPGATAADAENTQTAKQPTLDWKARYRLRHNWSRGKAEVRFINLNTSEETNNEDVSDLDEGANRTRSTGRLMVRLVNGVIITAGATEGLRAWDVKGGRVTFSKRGRGACVASYKFENPNCNPTCIGVDTSLAAGTDSSETGIVIGFADGGFGVWRLESQRDESFAFREYCRFNEEGNQNQLEHHGLHETALTAIAYAHPYLLTSAAQSLSLYSFNIRVRETNTRQDLCEPLNVEVDSTTTSIEANSAGSSDLLTNTRNPYLLTTLKSHTTWPPISLSIRPHPALSTSKQHSTNRHTSKDSTSCIVSIAYALPTYISGWTVGLQELHLSSTGTILSSRLASAVEAGFHSLLASTSNSEPSSPSASTTVNHSHGTGANKDPPTALSYAHPYLLTSHCDNTLCLYLITSTRGELKIGKGVRLWGHTSKVVNAVMGGRGRAVSFARASDGDATIGTDSLSAGLGSGIQKMSGEVRVWELEGGVLGRKGRSDGSIRISGEVNTSTISGETDEGLYNRELEGDDGFVGFDDEVVVVMREAKGGSLVVYDFT